MPTQLPTNYLLYNNLSSKNLVIAVEIPGLDLLTSGPIFTRIRYGDPHLFYGEPLPDGEIPVYGGLRRIDTARDILSIDSSMTISQRLEPEQGRASITTITMKFIDKDQYMTRAISPGKIIPDILGQPVKVWLGYQQTSFKEDYFVILRGKVAEAQVDPGAVTLVFQDPNFNRKQNIFFNGKAFLAADITNVDTTVLVDDNSDFYQQILGPNGGYDSSVATYIKIDSEYILVPPTGFGTNLFNSITRGTRGTVAAPHTTGATVESFIELQDHAIDMVLKLMLSGFGGPFHTGIPISSVVRTFDPVLGDQANTIILPQNVDAVNEYGLVSGDYITITGASNGANNATRTVAFFGDLFGQANRIIYLNGGPTMVEEFPTSSVMAMRSQYDTYPKLVGSALPSEEVDIQAHIDLKDSFLSDSANSYRFFVAEPSSCKTFSETEIYLPISAYSLTKRGRLSVGYTHPPLADQGLIILNQDNIIDPQSIRPMRSLNNRKFFNEVDYEWDVDDAGSFFSSTLLILDAGSLSLIGVSSVLKIKSKGARTDLGTDSLFSKRASFLLSRYRYGAIILSVKVNWSAGARIESGDVVALDGTNLSISNFATGDRNFGVQLFEVQNRALDIKSGNCTLELISGIGSDATDRFATYSPSSLVVSGTNASLIIQDSFGALYPGNEQRKWTDYLGQLIAVHSEDYSYYQTTTLQGFDPTNRYKMQVTGFGVLPPGSIFTNLIVDIINYPPDNNKVEASIYKSIHAFRGPQAAVVSGISTTQFTVSAPDAAKFFTNCIIQIHKEDFSVTSNDVKVQSIVGTTITLTAPLTFTPDNTYLVDGIGFPDGQGFYRYI